MSRRAWKAENGSRDGSPRRCTYDADIAIHVGRIDHDPKSLCVHDLKHIWTVRPLPAVFTGIKTHLLSKPPIRTDFSKGEQISNHRLL